VLLALEGFDAGAVALNCAARHRIQRPQDCVRFNHVILRFIGSTSSNSKPSTSLTTMFCPRAWGPEAADRCAPGSKMGLELRERVDRERGPQILARARSRSPRR